MVYGYFPINFFGYQLFAINWDLLYVFVPTDLRFDVGDVYDWVMWVSQGRWSNDPVISGLQPYSFFDSHFEYEAVYRLLTGNKLNPFGWFAANFDIVADLVTGGQATWYAGQYTAPGGDYDWWQGTFGAYFDAYYTQQISTAYGPIALFVFEWAAFQTQFLAWGNQFFHMFSGYTPNCPGKAVSTTKAWVRLFLWLPAWLSLVLVAPVRFIMLIFYFFYVTFVQVIASISSFFLGIKNWFDYVLFGWWYPQISWLWHNSFVFFLVFGIPFLLALTIFGFIWLLWTIFQFFINVLQWWEHLFSSTWWALWGWFYGFGWFFFWLPGWFYHGWTLFLSLLLEPLDDLCWGWFDIWDSWAAEIAEAFPQPVWQPGWFEIPFALPYMLIRYALA